MDRGQVGTTCCGGDAKARFIQVRASLGLCVQVGGGGNGRGMRFWGEGPV